MATLTGQSIASSYEQLLHTDTDGGGNGATLVPIKDGDNGTTFSLELATTSIAIGATHKLYLDGGGNTYITESSADTIQLATGGTTALIIGSDQSAIFSGVTTVKTDSSPAFIVEDANGDNQFQVNLNASNGAEIAVSDGGGSEKIRFSARSGGDSYINTAGSFGFGIGTTSPQDAVHIKTTADADIGLQVQNDDTQAFCKVQSAGSALYGGNNKVTFVSGGSYTTAMVIDTAQKVGIGTDSPSELLHLQSTEPVLRFTDSDDSNYHHIFASSDDLYISADRGETGTSAGNLIFRVGGTNVKMKLDVNSRISLGNNDSSGTVRNTIFGHQTGNVIASGALENTLFGYQAGLAISTGDYNTALGCLALQDEELGQGAVAIGGSALFSQNTGSQNLSHNVAVGLNTSYYNVTGINNTAVGALAMLGASGNSHSNNTAIGYAALLSTTTGDSNVAIGSMAGKDSTTGHENVYIGQSAGENATTHADNVMIGFEAGKNLAQNKCVAIGHKAYLNGAGDSNLAIGYQTMGSGSVSGYSNQAIGRQAMENLTGGDQNIAIGEQALQNNTTGNEQIAIGNTALRDCNGGVQNIAIGHESQQTHDSGDYNTSVGYRTLKDDTGNGNDNTAIGASALENFVAGSNGSGQNTAVGSYAGNSITSGNGNTLIGRKAGFQGTNDLVAGVANTLIGAEARANASDAGNCIAIGYQTVGQDHNSVTLGNADVTAVYMAQDSGATVHARHMNLIDSADDASGGILNLKNDRANPADNDEAGRIYMYADDDGGNATEAILMIGRMTDVTNGTEDSDLRIYTYNNGTAVNTLQLSSGALSKNSGSFKIDHPLESKKDTHHLVHSFVEGPQADNIYRGKATLSSGSVEINIDTVSGMSEGTFVLLNTDIQCFTSNESDWDAVKGSVSGNILTISCQNTDSTANVSWLVIGERQDQHMIDTNWTDENGKVIVEPLKN